MRQVMELGNILRHPQNASQRAAKEILTLAEMGKRPAEMRMELIQASMELHKIAEATTSLPTKRVVRQMADQMTDLMVEMLPILNTEEILEDRIWDHLVTAAHPKKKLNDDSDSGLQRPATDGATDTEAGTPDTATDASAGDVAAPMGTPERPAPPQTFKEYAERHGDADDLKEVVELLTGHDDQIHLGGEPNKDLVQVAIQQADYFEESSGNIQGVIEFKPEDTHWVGLTYADFRDEADYRSTEDELKIDPALFNKSRMRMRKAFEDNKRFEVRA